MTRLNWDRWRANYHDLTYAEQQAFHSAIYAKHPEQRHFDTRLVARAIADTQPRTIMELGGWDGELAHCMLVQYPTIGRWTNVELCREAAQAGGGRHPRYRVADLDDWYWNHGPWHADLFVASHVIEHLTSHDLTKVLAATRSPALFFDAPLDDHASNWRGFTGTHILEIGWAGVTALCREHGYHLAWAEDHATDQSSGGQARACLYTRTAA